MISIAPFQDFPEPVSVVLLTDAELCRLTRDCQHIDRRVLAVETIDVQLSPNDFNPNRRHFLAVLPDSVRAYLASEQQRQTPPPPPPSSSPSPTIKPPTHLQGEKTTA